MLAVLGTVRRAASRRTSAVRSGAEEKHLAALASGWQTLAGCLCDGLVTLTEALVVAGAAEAADAFLGRHAAGLPITELMREEDVHPFMAALLQASVTQTPQRLKVSLLLQGRLQLVAVVAASIGTAGGLDKERYALSLTVPQAPASQLAQLARTEGGFCSPSTAARGRKAEREQRARGGGAGGHFLEPGASGQGGGGAAAEGAGGGAAAGRRPLSALPGMVVEDAVDLERASSIVPGPCSHASVDGVSDSELASLDLSSSYLHYDEGSLPRSVTGASLTASELTEASGRNLSDLLLMDRINPQRVPQVAQTQTEPAAASQEAGVNTEVAWVKTDTSPADAQEPQLQPPEHGLGRAGFRGEELLGQDHHLLRGGRSLAIALRGRLAYRGGVQAQRGPLAEGPADPGRHLQRRGGGLGPAHCLGGQGAAGGGPALGAAGPPPPQGQDRQDHRLPPRHEPGAAGAPLLLGSGHRPGCLGGPLGGEAALKS